jgi:hypothetical protein
LTFVAFLAGAFAAFLFLTIGFGRDDLPAKVRLFAADVAIRREDEREDDLFMPLTMMPLMQNSQLPIDHSIAQNDHKSRVQYSKA